MYEDPASDQGLDRTAVRPSPKRSAPAGRDAQDPRRGQASFFARHERACLVALPLSLWIFGYHGLNFLTWGRQVVHIDLALDRAVPQVPLLIYVYSLAYPCCFIPAIVLSIERVRLAVFAYSVTILASLAMFVWMPVEIVRPDPPPGSWGNWLVYLTRLVDQPFNCFPSLHVSLDFLSAFFCGLERPRLGAALLVTSVAISVSTLFVKQHYALDVVAGFLMAALAFRLTLLDPVRRLMRGPSGTTRDGSASTSPRPSAA